MEKTNFWHPIARNGWITKFSVYKETNILLIIISQYTGQVIVRYFGNEDDACLFINYIHELDAEKLVEL